MKILAVQNRMGIGDTVIFLPFIKAISRRFNTPVSLLVKKSSKAEQYLYQTNYLDKIIFLERDKKKDQRHNGIIGSFRLAQDLKKYKFDKIFIFNSSLRYFILRKQAIDPCSLYIIETSVACSSVLCCFSIASSIYSTNASHSSLSVVSFLNVIIIV